MENIFQVVHVTIKFDIVHMAYRTSFRVEQSTNQGGFSPIKIFDPGCKHFYGQYVSDYPLEMFQVWIQCAIISM